MPDKITEMYAFVLLDDNLGKGDEGVSVIRLGDMAFPMVAADMESMESLRPYAEKLANEGSKIELRKFRLGEVLEVLG